MTVENGFLRISTFVVLGIALAVLFLVAHLFFSPLGFLAVRAACAEVGGVRIHESQDVAGYWHGGYDGRENYTYADCPRCVENVVSKKFSYVDFESKDASSGLPVGFIRFHLADAGSDDCVDGIAKYRRPPAGTCVAVTRMSGAPTSGYKYTSRILRNRNWFGVAIRERNRTVIEVSTGRVVAIAREFDYQTPWEEYGKFAPSYRCDRNLSRPINEETFVLTALRSGLAKGGPPLEQS